jgi:CheY-like chemotaxis protein
MRILVADDDLVSRLAMEDVLRQCGHPETVLAEDGASAWQQMSDEPCFDLLCLDVRMPPPDGLELVARLRAAPALKRVPAMLITSTADRHAVLGATCSDLQGFIVKPVGDYTVTRILRVLAQLDASILEPVAAATGSRMLVRCAAPTAGSQAGTAFVQKADACRTAALTLGSPRIEQLISDALALLAEGKPGAERAMAQAVYWLARVARRAA